MEKMYAICYNSYSFEQNEKESIAIKRMMGEIFYLANPSRVKDLEALKYEIRRNEGVTKEVDLVSSKKYTFRSNRHGSGSLDNF